MSSEYHIVIKKKVESGEFKTIYDSKVYPKYKLSEYKLNNLSTICNNDMNKPLKVEF